MDTYMQRGLPAARIDGLVITESKNDVLVYDTAQHHVHHLNQLSAVVWRLCDGRRTVADLVREAQIQIEGQVNEESVRLALTKLSDAELLDASLHADMRGSGRSRRAFLRKAAIAGAAVPVIASISAPNAAASHSSGCTHSGNNCSSGAQCCSGNCHTNGKCTG